jgi:hypothetical protein
MVGKAFTQILQALPFKEVAVVVVRFMTVEQRVLAVQEVVVTVVSIHLPVREQMVLHLQAAVEEVVPQAAQVS